MKVLHSVRDPKHFTIEDAEKMRDQGAEVEYSGDGLVRVYVEREVIKNERNHNINEQRDQRNGFCRTVI